MTRASTGGKCRSCGAEVAALATRCTRCTSSRSGNAPSIEAILEEAKGRAAKEAGGAFDQNDEIFVQSVVGVLLIALLAAFLILWSSENNATASPVGVAHNDPTPSAPAPPRTPTPTPAPANLRTSTMEWSGTFNGKSARLVLKQGDSVSGTLQNDGNEEQLSGSVMADGSYLLVGVSVQTMGGDPAPTYSLDTLRFSIDGRRLIGSFRDGNGTSGPILMKTTNPVAQQSASEPHLRFRVTLSDFPLRLAPSYDAKIFRRISNTEGLDGWQVSDRPLNAQSGITTAAVPIDVDGTKTFLPVGTLVVVLSESDSVLLVSTGTGRNEQIGTMSASGIVRTKSETEAWVRVRTSDGAVGFVPLRFLKAQ